jgi:hypothetical protein
MKRKSALLVIVFTFFLSSAALAAPVLSIGDYTAGLGTLGVSISISGITNEVIKDFSFTLNILPTDGNLIFPSNFDSTVTAGSAIPVPASFAGFKATDFSSFFFYSPFIPNPPQLSDGVLANLNLSVLGLGLWTLELTDLAFGAGGTSVDVTADNGSVSTVPIPAAVWLLSGGLAGLMALRRRMS